MPRIAIWGAGGIGGFFGGRLAASGCEVGFIARGAHLEAIRRDGLRVESVDGDFTVTPSIATDDPAEIGPVDVVILGVETWHLPEVMAGLELRVEGRQIEASLLSRAVLGRVEAGPVSRA